MSRFAKNPASSSGRAMYTGLRNACIAALAAVLLISIPVSQGIGQPRLDAGETEDFLVSFLGNDLGIYKSQVRIENGTVFIGLNLDQDSAEEIVGKLGLVLLTAGTAAHWTDTVRVIGYEGAAPLFAMSVATSVIAAYSDGEMDDIQFISQWRFDGIEQGLASQGGSTADAPPVSGRIELREPAADTHVYAYSWQDWNVSNWGRYDVLGAGWNPIGGEKRSLLSFDLSGIDPRDVISAKLRLYHYHTAGDASQPLGVFRLTQPWQEGRGTYKPATPALPGEVTWEFQPDYDPRPVVRLDLTQQPGSFIDVDMTALIMGWASGLPNHGLMIRSLGQPDQRSPESMFGFYAREHADREKRPVLVLTLAGGGGSSMGKASAKTGVSNTATGGSSVSITTTGGGTGSTAATGGGGTTNVTQITSPGQSITDEGWKVTADIPPTQAWMRPGYDDRGWQAAVTAWRLQPAPAQTISGMSDTTADWIWHRNDPDLVHFRRVFELGYLPIEAMLRITADNNYEVYVNGALVGRDAGNVISVWNTAETYDVARYLRTGENVISVVAQDLGGGSGLLTDLTFGGPSTLPSAGPAAEPPGKSTDSSSTATPVDKGSTGVGSMLAQAKAMMGSAHAVADPDRRNDQFAQAMILLEEVAKAGSAEALYHIGFLHEIGAGVVHDNDIAVAYYEEAARGGYEEAFGQLILVLNQLRRYQAAAVELLRYHKAFPQAAEQGFEDHAYSPMVLRAVQEVLQKAGYYKGGIDGIVGSGTLDALRRYVAVEMPEEVIDPQAGAAASTVSSGGTDQGSDDAVQLAFWQSIEKSTDAAEFEAYLARWPNGVFSDLARNRLNRLLDGGGAGVSVNPQPMPVVPAYTPARGTAERQAIMDAARAPISSDIGQPVVFVVDELRSNGRFAFLQAVPTQASGSPIAWEQTRFAEEWRQDMMSDIVMVLLENQNDRFRVIDYVIGPTDVYWYGWIEQYGLDETFFFPQVAE
jgi:hypothetical protein